VNRDELIPILAERLASAGSDAWLTRLDEAGIPSAPIRDVRAALDSPQAQALGSVVPLSHPELGRVDQVAPPFHLAETPAAVRMPPPLLGEQADEILAEAGFDAAAIAALRRDGIV
jgi:formyl-CoA transferase/CoA:oxalate CoA-transferase